MPKKAELGYQYFDATNGYWIECVRGHALFPGRTWVAAHRVRMAEKLGRPLERWELVHHKDENKQRNAKRNLALTTRSAHPTLHSGQKRSAETKVKMAASAKARCTSEWREAVATRVKQQHRDGKFGRRTWRSNNA